jgi:hypothetical protein
MKTKIVIGVLCIAVVLAWTGVAAAQAAPTPKLQLPSGETVWDLSGDWEAFIENYGPRVGDGTYPNVYRFTQTGGAFQAIRLRDNPPPTVGKAGSSSLQGELGKDGFKRVDIVRGRGDVVPSKGHISEDGRKIVIDDGFMITVTLTRP